MKAHAQSGQFTGRHMIMIMVAFFGVVITVNTVLAVMAVKSWTGLVVPNSYVASQQFNKETARRMQAINAGAKADVVQQGGRVLVTFKGRSGEPLEADKLVLVVGHPVDAKVNHKIAFKAADAGAFTTEEPLPPGTWVGEISATLKGYGDWVHPVRLLVKE